MQLADKLLIDALAAESRTSLQHCVENSPECRPRTPQFHCVPDNLLSDREHTMRLALMDRLTPDKKISNHKPSVLPHLTRADSQAAQIPRSFDPSQTVDLTATVQRTRDSYIRQVKPLRHRSILLTVHTHQQQYPPLQRWQPEM